MTIQTLKIMREFADAVVDGRKKFEVRNNDRNFKEGQLVKFTAIHNGMAVKHHPINSKTYIITYILGEPWSIPGHVIFGMEEVSR